MNIQRSKLEQLQASGFAPVTNTCLPALLILVNGILRCWCAEILRCLGWKAQNPIWDTMKYPSGLWERSKAGCSTGFYPSPQQPAPHFCLPLPQRPNPTAAGRYVPAPGSPIPAAVLSCQHLHCCLKVCLWCSGGRGLGDKGRGVSYRQKSTLTCYSKICHGLVLKVLFLTDLLVQRVRCSKTSKSLILHFYVDCASFLNGSSCWVPLLLVEIGYFAIHRCVGISHT